MVQDLRKVFVIVEVGTHTSDLAAAAAAAAAAAVLLKKPAATSPLYLLLSCRLH